MTITIAGGAVLEPLAIPLCEARGAIYAVVHRASGRVYVGMTNGTVTARWAEHCRDAKRETRRYYFASAIRKYGAGAFDVHVLAASIQRSDLAAAERDHIHALGAARKGCGFNSTTGGDGGYLFTEEVRAKIGEAGRGRVCSDGQRAKLSVAGKGRKRSPEAHAKWLKHRVGLTFDDEARAAMSAAHVGKRPSVETRAKMSEAQRRRHASGKLKESHAVKMRAHWADPAYKERVAKKIREAHARADVQAKLRAPRVLSDATRQALREAANRRWAKSAGG